MLKIIAIASPQNFISKTRTRMAWTNNLNVQLPVGPNRFYTIPGNDIHRQLRKTLLKAAPDYREDKKNFVIANATLIVSDGRSTYRLDAPINLRHSNRSFGRGYRGSCHVNNVGGRWINHETVVQHVKKRLSDASEQGFRVSSENFPKNKNEEMHRFYHSEQALIEFLETTNLSFQTLLNGFKSKLEGLKKYFQRNIERLTARLLILDIYSKYYVCEFCETSLLGLQNSQWIKRFGAYLKQKRFIIQDNGLKFFSRISSENPSTRIPKRAQQQAVRNIYTINLATVSRVLLAKDISLDAPYKKGTLPYATLFKSGINIKPKTRPTFKVDRYAPSFNRDATITFSEMLDSLWNFFCSIFGISFDQPNTSNSVKEPSRKRKRDDSSGGDRSRKRRKLDKNNR